MNSQSRHKTFLLCHGAWGGGWSWKMMHPLMQSAGHRLLTPTYTGLGERAHLANPDVDLETHIQDILNVINYEDLRDFVLLGHSYGGMVATGVADRARDVINQVIYLDAFVPRDGQSLFDLNEPGRQPMSNAARAGDGWRIPPNPSPPDVSQADLDKPRGFAALDQDQARAMLADKPVGFIFGVGPRQSRRRSGDPHPGHPQRHQL